MTCLAILTHAARLVALPAALHAAEVEVGGKLALPHGAVAMVAVPLHRQEVRLVLETRADEHGPGRDRPDERRPREEMALDARPGQRLDRLLLALPPFRRDPGGRHHAVGERFRSGAQAIGLAPPRRVAGGADRVPDLVEAGQAGRYAGGLRLGTDAPIESPDLGLDRLLPHPERPVVEASQRSGLGEPPLELAEAGQQRAPLGRPALGVDLAPKLAQVEEHPFVRVADDALAHLAPSDLELLAPSRPGPAHAQGGDPVRRERIVLRDGFDDAQGSVLGVKVSAVDADG